MTKTEGPLRIANRYPDSLPGEQLAPLVGYEYSGGFRNNLSKLRTLGLIEGTNTSGVSASGVFFEIEGAVSGH